MAIKCVAIDDEPLALDIIKTYVGRFKNLELVQVFEDAIAASEFLRTGEFCSLKTGGRIVSKRIEIILNLPKYLD